MLTVRIEAVHMGVNMGRLEGFRLVVGALGGKVERVTATPSFDEYWNLDIAVIIPAVTRQRCGEIAKKMFDGPVIVTDTGTREGPEDA